MSAEIVSTQPDTRGRDIRSIFSWWLEPRSTDRDEAFRERSIRVAIAVVVLVGLISFAATVFVFQNEWRLISFPTLHIQILVGFLISAYTVSRGQINTSAAVLVISTLIAAGGFMIVLGPESPYAVLISGIALFMFVILITALVMSRNFILPISGVSVALYIVAILATSDSLLTLTALDLSPAYVAALVLFPTEGAILYRLRLEFDARLQAMRESIQQAELAQRQAEAARQQAEASDRAKSQFLANMSHELRTPLNAIIGYDEAMLGGLAGEFSPQQTKLLGHIQYNSRRLLGLINDILDLSKIESGSLQVFLAPMSPRKAIQDAADSLRSLAEQKRIDLNVQFSENIPEVVLSDAAKLQQVLTNLLSNAIKFTEQGNVTVTVDAVDTANWQIKVQDTGIGMPSDASDYIFEPFRQVDSTDQRKYKGTGLGLAITKRLVEGLSGTINVETKLGEGSTFTVKLPRTRIPGETTGTEPAKLVELEQ